MWNAVKTMHIDRTRTVQQSLESPVRNTLPKITYATLSALTTHARIAPLREQIANCVRASDVRDVSTACVRQSTSTWWGKGGETVLRQHRRRWDARFCGIATFRGSRVRFWFIFYTPRWEVLPEICSRTNASVWHTCALAKLNSRKSSE